MVQLKAPEPEPEVPTYKVKGVEAIFLLNSIDIYQPIRWLGFEASANRNGVCQLLFLEQLAFSDFTIAPCSNAAVRGPCADLNNKKKGVNHLWPEIFTGIGKHCDYAMYD